MRKLWQQDMLRFLTNRRFKPGTDDPGLPYGLHLPLKNVRLDLHLGGDDARLSNFVSRKKNHAYKLSFNAEEIYDSLIQPWIDEGRIRPEEALRNFHAFLRVEGIEDTWRSFSDFRTCMIAALSEGLERHYPMESETDALPRLHAQRFVPNAQFTGREVELAQLKTVLENQGAAVLTGIGGMGKTVLADEYARRQAGRYDARQIVTSEPGFTSFADLILAVDWDDREPEKGLSREEILGRRMDLLCGLDSSALLIFDNVDGDLDDYGLFRRLLRDSGAHIIVTTRRQRAFPEGTLLEVDALSPEEQLELLAAGMERSIRSDEAEAASEICRRVDGHTLAVQLVGRSIRRQKLTCPQMLERLSGLSGFAAFQAEVQIHKDDYNRSQQILRFVRELLFSLEPLGPQEQELMRCLTLLPLDGLQRSVLTSPELGVDDSMLAALEDSGWIIYDDGRGTVRVHPVIREAVMAELTVDSHMCTPFLSQLDQALWEPEVTPQLPEMLRLAANIVDMLFLSDELREFLRSDRIEAVFEQVYDLVQGQSVWERWHEELTEWSEDEEITETSADTLRMYAAFCTYMGILDRARRTGSQSLAAPWLDTGLMLEAAADNDESEELRNALKEFIELFIALHADQWEDGDEEALLNNPEAIVQLATSVVGAELTDYLQETGRALSGSDNPDTFPSLFRLLSSSDLKLLESVSTHAYSSFLVTVLEAFSVSQALLPYVVSTPVFALTQLFILLRASTAEIKTWQDIAADCGWRFPAITYLPAKLDPHGELRYTEELWGQPLAEAAYTGSDASLIITMSRPNREVELDRFDLWDSQEVEHTQERIIRARIAPGRGQSDVQVELGPWSVRIQGLRGINKKEAVKIARGLQLPAADAAGTATEADSAAALRN